MLTRSQSYKLYRLAQQHFDKEEDIATLVSKVETVFDENHNIGNDQVATKNELRKLLNQLQVEMKEQKAEMIKWMFIFWIGQITATLAIVLLFLKK